MKKKYLIVLAVAVVAVLLAVLMPKRSVYTLSNGYEKVKVDVSSVPSRDRKVIPHKEYLQILDRNDKLIGIVRMSTENEWVSEYAQAAKTVYEDKDDRFALRYTIGNEDGEKNGYTIVNSTFEHTYLNITGTNVYCAVTTPVSEKNWLSDIKLVAAN